MESTLKTKFGQEKDKVSCVDPKTYSKRFIKYFYYLTNIKHMLMDGQKNDFSDFVIIDQIIKDEDIIKEEDYENEESLKINQIKLHSDSNVELKHF